MNIFELTQYATKVFRKGEVVQTQTAGSIKVVEIFGYPHASEAPGDLAMYDLVFVDVGVGPNKATEVKGDLITWLSRYPQRERLVGGPSYIELAGNGEIEQETAFRIFALMENLGMGEIMTLRSLVPEATDDQVRDMAGSGMLYIVPNHDFEAVLV